MHQGARKKLGDILVDAGILSLEQLDRGLDHSRKKTIQVGQALIRLGFVSAEEIMFALSEQLHLPYVSLSSYQIDTEAVKLVSEQDAREMHLIPLFTINTVLTVAMANPMDIFTLDDLAMKTGLEVEPAICSDEELDQALDDYYGSAASVQEVVQIIQEKEGGDGLTETIHSDITFLDSAEEAPVIKLVNLIFSQAIKDGVSDIHVEPQEDKLLVRFRIDGLLTKAYEQPKNLQRSITSRIKIMARMDIAERRLPQDGRIQLRIDNRDIDFRVSTMPTANGENIVLRLLDKSNVLVDMKDLGFTTHMLDKFIALLNRPYGIILVTGPTGSGKTTTLYSALHTLNGEDKNIHTIEDPIEYRLPLIRQTQVSTKIGLTFAAGLRAFLRQDPDIIMVGEIRDLETATVATQAALTGHMVLSTLHTNDAPGAVSRLVDMGVEAFLVTSALAGVVAQRLVRRICNRCTEQYTPSPALIKQLKLKPNGSYQLSRGKGCRYCKNKGYRGRLALFELMELTDSLKEKILMGGSSAELRRLALREGMKSLYHDGIMKALKGLTTVEEVMRVSMTE